MVRLSSVLATAAFVFPIATVAVETKVAEKFVSADETFAFALNIPERDESNSLYFTLRGLSRETWVAVGIGSETMAGALMFMAYADSTGRNVTVSPRLASGHVEPSYTSSVSVEVLPGSEIADNIMTVNARCDNCRSWKGGSINATSTAAPFVYAMGGGDKIKSNSMTVGVKRHWTYGSFVMDLTKAVGSGGIPDNFTADTQGSIQLTDKGDRDYAGVIHACLMILVFVGLFPGGIVLLRIFKSPMLHGLCQTFSVVVALVGLGLGAYSARLYNRTKNFNSAHQVFGLIIITMMIGQYVLGVLHHIQFRKTKLPTKLAPIHIWLGRLVIPCGIADGFLGFPLARNSKYNWTLLSLTLFVLVVIGPLLFWRYRLDLKKSKDASQPGSDSETGGYQSQPWRSAEARSDINLGPVSYPPPYGQPPQQGRQFV